MSVIAGVSSCFPPHYYSQEELITVLRRFWQGRRLNIQRLEGIHRNTTVTGRHLALPIDAYDDLSGFEDSNLAWTREALNLGEKTLNSLFDQAGIEASEISQISFTTITGIAVPSIDARLMNRLPFKSDLKRVPIFGLGCLGGAAGVARVADYLRGHPDEAAVLLSIELCSLTLQRDDVSIENIVASALFGDGAAAVLMVGDEHPLAAPGRPRVLDSRSVFFPDSEHIMGWEVRSTGLKVVLSADVADVAGQELKPAVTAFLEKHNLRLEDITHWIAHPGGPKVIQALEEGLGLGEKALDLSRQSLAKVGNISSTSVLLILQETLAQNSPSPGTYGLMLAMGPAFCAEMVLLQW